jgi:hypothetical protein
MGSIHQVGSQATPKILRVLPRGMALVPDYSVLQHPGGPLRYYHGWEWDLEQGGPVMEPDQGGKWAPTGKLSGALKRTSSQVIEVPDAAEYRRHLVGDPRSPDLGGDLWPADEETARAVGIKFWPTHDLHAEQFAEEHPEHAKLLPKASGPKTGTRVPVSTPAPSEVSK